MQFHDNHTCVDFCNPRSVHDNFLATGALTVGYLRFLWRDIDEAGDESVFARLVVTMSEHGVMFKSELVAAGQEGADPALDDNVELFVPVRLPSFIQGKDLHSFGDASDHHKYRMQRLISITQSYVPPGIVGLMMARLLCYNVQFHKCWSRGASFMLTGSEVLLSLNPESLEINVTGASGDVESVMKKLTDIIKTLFGEQFPGLRIHFRKSDPRSFYAKDALMKRIDALQRHLDARLEIIEHGLQKASASSSRSLAHITKLQAKGYPYPRRGRSRSVSGECGWREEHLEQAHLEQADVPGAGGSR